MIYVKNSDNEIYISKTTATAEISSAVVFVDGNRANKFEIPCTSEVVGDFYKINLDLTSLQTGEYEYIFGVENGLLKITSYSDSIYYDKNIDYITYDA